jgi:hypothetical protein
MQLACLHCQHSAFKVWANGTVRLECLNCGTESSVAALRVFDTLATDAIAKPRLARVSK